MIDLYYWPTGNGKKVSIMLEETKLDYRVIPIDIRKGDQHQPDFLKISPNNKMPAIVDHDSECGPLTIFESGAILTYLAEKTGQFMPSDLSGRMKVQQWLFWQVGGLGPMCGQAHYFLHYSDTKYPESMARFEKEVTRLYGVLDRQLGESEYIAGEYSIADMAAWPWVYRYDWQGQNLDDYPNIQRWFDIVGARTGVQRGVAVGNDLADMSKDMSQEEKQRLFSLNSEKG